MEIFQEHFTPYTLTFVLYYNIHNYWPVLLMYRTSSNTAGNNTGNKNPPGHSYQLKFCFMFLHSAVVMKIIIGRSCYLFRSSTVGCFLCVLCTQFVLYDYTHGKSHICFSTYILNCVCVSVTLMTGICTESFPSILIHYNFYFYEFHMIHHNLSERLLYENLLLNLNTE
jgi:hypothetical protein